MAVLAHFYRLPATTFCLVFGRFIGSPDPLSGLLCRLFRFRVVVVVFFSLVAAGFLSLSARLPVQPHFADGLLRFSLSLSLSLSLSAEFYWSPLPSLSGFASLTPSAQPLYWFLDECLPRFAFVSFVFYWIVTAFLVLSGFSSRLKKRFEHGNAE